MTPKTLLEIDHLRTSGQMLAAVLGYLAPLVQPGVTTAELGEMAAAELKRLGGRPAFLGYRGFPSCICISVNEEVVHGIPDQRVINGGDLVGLDFGVSYNGMITDSAITLGVGRIGDDAQRLLAATREALSCGIKAVKAGARVGDISQAVQRRLERDRLGIVEELAGHGVGHSLHEEPWIPNFGAAGTGPRLEAGMTIAIEPMATLGGKAVAWGDDGWTISAADGSLSAHFEHTVLVTDTGAEILTKA
ncbi:type I methionyl aminopeptidase [Candidatus Parcubacteria bacterium]|nr:type I methionyl aminopeptidase [Candidatus Parcubacteria bacterium]